jgi:hypothetical protein
MSRRCWSRLNRWQQPTESPRRTWSKVNSQRSTVKVETSMIRGQSQFLRPCTATGGWQSGR